jgi:hypothetical protein
MDYWMKGTIKGDVPSIKNESTNTNGKNTVAAKLKLPLTAPRLQCLGILLVTKQAYSHFLASYWSRSKHIPVSWHPIGHEASIFPFPGNLLVTKQAYSRFLATYWSRSMSGDEPLVPHLHLPTVPAGREETSIN